MTGRVIVRNGRWNLIINYKDHFGKHKQKWIQTELPERGNKKEAQKRLEQELLKFKADINENKGVINANSKDDPFFIPYIREYVLSKKSDVTPLVFNTYNLCVNIMEKYFGNKLKLKDVTVKHLTDFYDYLRNERGNKNTTVKHYTTIIRPALRNAYRDDLIRKNPCDFVPKLKREKSPKRYFNKDEIEIFFKAIEKHPMKLVYKIATYYGFRRSETLGLKWDAVDFENKTITIKHSLQIIDKKVYAIDKLKTDASERVLPLLPVIEGLLIKKKEQIEHNRKIYGRSYNQQFLDYICVNDVGEVIKPDHVSKTFAKILKANGLKHMRNHDLRRTCGSLLAQNGVPMKNIQDWLGHSNFKTTADIYSELDFSAKHKSAKIIDSLISRKTDSELSPEDEIEELERLLELKRKELKSRQESEM